MNPTQKTEPVFWLIKEVEVYAPEPLGVKDVLLGGGSILAIENPGTLTPGLSNVEVLDGKGRLLVPGFVDGHVHLIGGGGEGGYKTRTPEAFLSDITTGGVTTVLGLLGTDGVTRSPEALLAKARGLEEEGISVWIFTGSYRVPPVTLTGSVQRDIILIDKCIGTGEIALSDHRSSQPSYDELLRLVADTRAAGILSGKCGIVQFHMGDGKRTLEALWRMVRETEIPIAQVVPTHINRNPYLFEEGIEWAKAGGYVDSTTSTTPLYLEEGEVKCSRTLKILLDAGVALDRITFSSDGQGSLPNFDAAGKMTGLGIGTCRSLWPEVREAVNLDRVPLEKALCVVTANPAAAYKLPRKGRLVPGFDADAVLLSSDLEIDSVIARGRMMVRERVPIVKGTFEQ